MIRKKKLKYVRARPSFSDKNHRGRPRVYNRSYRNSHVRYYINRLLSKHCHDSNLNRTIVSNTICNVIRGQNERQRHETTLHL